MRGSSSKWASFALGMDIAGLTRAGDYDTQMETNESSTQSATPSWSVLLAGWVSFAQTAIALPKEGEGGRWRDSVAPTIGLHAITMALGEIEKVDPEERPLAMDRAEIGIKGHIAELNEIWKREPIPESINELIQDAKDAWEVMLHEGVVWVVKSERFVSFHPAELAERVLDAGYTGEILMSSPGVEMFKGAPLAIVRNNSGGQPEDDILNLIEGFLNACDGDIEQPQIVRPICQVYRQFDFLNNGAGKDLVAPVTGDLQSGQPLLVPVVSGGEMCAVPLPPKLGKPLDLHPVEWVQAEADDEIE